MFLEAISSIPTDESGIESTFTTVAEIISRWGCYADTAHCKYHPIIIVITDEAGDDQDKLEHCVELAQRVRVPVYVLGSQAVFVQVEGYMSYVDPNTGGGAPGKLKDRRNSLRAS